MQSPLGSTTPFSILSFARGVCPTPPTASWLSNIIDRIKPAAYTIPHVFVLGRRVELPMISLLFGHQR
jgi:hypothetical protein